MLKSIKRVFLLSIFMLACTPVFSMHIMEGYLPASWSGIWYAIMLPFLIYAYRELAKKNKINPKYKITLALAGAFVFVLSALKLPSVTGSSSHLTGTSLGAIVIGPIVMPLVGVIVLLFQALLLAHGGITTLGANVFSMAIVGPWLAYFIYVLGMKAKINQYLVVFFSAFMGDLITYVTTSFQLAVAYPDSLSGIMGAALKFLSVFAVTQMPLAIIEGFITVAAYKMIRSQGIEPVNILARSASKTI